MQDESPVEYLRRYPQDNTYNYDKSEIKESYPNDKNKSKENYHKDKNENKKSYPKETAPKRKLTNRQFKDIIRIGLSSAPPPHVRERYTSCCPVCKFRGAYRSFDIYACKTPGGYAMFVARYGKECNKEVLFYIDDVGKVQDITKGLPAV